MDIELRVLRWHATPCHLIQTKEMSVNCDI